MGTLGRAAQPPIGPISLTSLFSVHTKRLATRSYGIVLVLAAPDRAQVFLLYCDLWPVSQALLLALEMELADQAARAGPGFLELRYPEASMDTPAALGARKAAVPIAQNPTAKYRVAVISSSVCHRVRLKRCQSLFYMLFRIHRRPPESLTPCACVTDPCSIGLPAQRQFGRAKAGGG